MVTRPRCQNDDVRRYIVSCVVQTAYYLVIKYFLYFCGYIQIAPLLSISFYYLHIHAKKFAYTTQSATVPPTMRLWPINRRSE